MTKVSITTPGTAGPEPLPGQTRYKTIVGGAIGNCVHVTGVYEYLRTADRMGYRTRFLGAAVDTRTFVEAIEKNRADIVCVSYRLTPANLGPILENFFAELAGKDLVRGKIFYFGGTPPCIEVAEKTGRFSHFFKGEEPHAEICETLFVKDQPPAKGRTVYERLPLHYGTLDPAEMKKIAQEGRFIPLIRHHFGLPSLEDTIAGIRTIARSGMVDVISLGPDQNAQEFFFEPEKMDPALDGTGGVPVRTREDLLRIRIAAQEGNFPRLRIYAGTQNLMQWAPMSVSLINNAWGTIPLFWYSELDGRSRRPLKEALRENREVIRWYAEQGIPVEINDSHQWSLRDTSDVIAVAAFYLAAYNAKKLGVKTYIAQFMFNTPRTTSAKMDLAKMLAKLAMIERLEDESFVCMREVRAGLTHFSVDQDIAKGQLAASTLLALTLKPQIIHVVSFSEADHAATAADVIESCKIVRGVVKNAGQDFPDLSLDPEVIARKNHLIEEAEYLLNAIKEAFKDESPDPLADAETLAKIVTHGFFDAPQLKNNPVARGSLRTMPIYGGIEAVDPQGMPIFEEERIQRLLP